MSAGQLPIFIAIKQYDRDMFVSYENNADDAHFERPVLRGESVFDTLVKIEVEPAKNGSSDVHLRFCHSNRYLQVNPADYSIYARSKQPEEDTSKISCTLFTPIFLNNDEGLFRLNHVNTGYHVQINYPSLSLYNGPADFEFYSGIAFYYRDWDTLVKMPKHVAFKGDNGKYLEGVVVNGNPFLKFSSDDPTAEASGHEVELMPDGHIRIKSDHFGKFWRRSPNWIWADSSDAATGDADTLFSVVKVTTEDSGTDSIVALRNAGNNQFCSRLSAEHNYDCLNAAVTTMTNEAKLEVKELVMERKIYGVVYRMEDARIFNEAPYKAGYDTQENRSDQVSDMAVSVTYLDEKSYTFSRSTSLTAGVSTTIEAGVPFIEEASIEVSFEISESLEWDNTTTTSSSVTATGSVPVPPRSIATIDYVGTKGTCNVPYSYKQQDRSSTDGKIVYSDLIDGIYNGVNCYNFHFTISKIDPLP